jgi:AcrR family transcriptional regulator
MMASDVRNRILDAAVRLLVEQGGNALTQPKIAAAAGVRQSHLTYYFPKRNDLLLAVTLHWAETHLKAATRQVGAGPGTMREATHYLSDTVVEAARVRIILSLIVTAAEDPRIREPLRELIESERSTVGSLMQAVGAPLDADGAAILHATLVGLAVLRVARGSTADRESRSLVKQALEELVPAMSKSAKRRATRRVRRRAA